MSRKFVGFGFGPIQSALMIREAQRSGNFDSHTIAEVDGRLVQAIRSQGGTCAINVAGRDGIRREKLVNLNLVNPTEPEGREAIVAAIAEADEMATALPSVRFFDSDPQTSVAKMIADGLARRRAPKPAVVYTAENNNHAASILREAVAKYASGGTLAQFQTLDTVVGKMSGVITDPNEIQTLGLETMAPGIARAVLVEEFNRILISRVALPGFTRGIEVFVEKDDLLPFEEAKLYGHNAIHALLAYLCALRGCRTIAEAAHNERLMRIARLAFLNESGAALVRRHAALRDPLFTDEGWRLYAEDLLERMTNPHLHDLTERVGRDPIRKLGWDDRLYGTIRIALATGIEPRAMAMGAAAGVAFLLDHPAQGAAELPPNAPRSIGELTEETLGLLLRAIWGPRNEAEVEALVGLTWKGWIDLRREHLVG